MHRIQLCLPYDVLVGLEFPRCDDRLTQLLLGHLRGYQHLYVLFLHFLGVLHSADKFLYEVDPRLIFIIIQTRSQGPRRQHIM